MQSIGKALARNPVSQAVLDGNMEARKERRCVVGVFFEAVLGGNMGAGRQRERVVGVFFEAVLMGTWEMKTCKRDF